MQNAIDKMIEALNVIFSDLDNAYIENSKVWAAGRVQAVREMKNSDGFKFDEKGYQTLFAIAGGKTWYNLFDGRSLAAIEELVVKNCHNVISKRNAAIAVKLEKAGIAEVISQEFSRSADGFDGVFVVQTDKGRQTVTINTITAGGYAVQALHQRTLVKVR